MRSDRILLAHGSGGTMMRELIEEVFVAEFADDALQRLDDAASLDVPRGRLAFSTDTYVVTRSSSPAATSAGSRSAAPSTTSRRAARRRSTSRVGFVLEEGFPVDDLRRILVSMRDAAAEAGVHIVTGDTKVVEKGHGDGIYINTAGVGVARRGRRPLRLVLQAGRQGAALRHARRPRHRDRLDARGPRVRDRHRDRRRAARTRSSPPCSPPRPTRAASATPRAAGSRSTLNELATPPASRSPSTRPPCPCTPQVRGASEMLGYDVFQVANEGKMVAVVPAEQAEAALAAMKASPVRRGRRDHRRGRRGARRARSTCTPRFGATRIMDMLVGEQLPRIC